MAKVSSRKKGVLATRGLVEQMVDEEIEKVYERVDYVSESVNERLDAITEQAYNVLDECEDAQKRNIVRSTELHIAAYGAIASVALLAADMRLATMVVAGLTLLTASVLAVVERRMKKQRDEEAE